MYVIEVPFISIDQIYNSFQAPRWIKYRDGKYVIPLKNVALKAEQQKDRLILSCNDADFYAIWWDYFDLQTDYSQINYAMKRQHKKFNVPANRGSGLHILQQDKFEMYVYCKLVQNVGWYKARELMNRIANTYGIEHKQSMREAGRVTWYEWPNPEMLLKKLEKEKNMHTKVKSFLYKLCDAIVNDGYDITKHGNELYRLIGMHDFTAFPLLGVSETIEKNFKCDADWFCVEYLDGFEYPGMIYMTILHHISNPPKEARYGLS